MRGGRELSAGTCAFLEIPGVFPWLALALFSRLAPTVAALTVVSLIVLALLALSLYWLSLALTLLTLHYAGSHYAASAAASLRWRPDSLRSKSHLRSLRVQRKCAMIGVVHLNSKIGEEVCDDWCGASEQLECRGSVL